MPDRGGCKGEHSGIERYMAYVEGRREEVAISGVIPMR